MKETGISKLIIVTDGITYRLDRQLGQYLLTAISV